MLTTRRHVLQGVGAVGLALVAGCAQPFSAPPLAVRVYRIAQLQSSPPNPTLSDLMSAFWQSLRDLGYVEGQNLHIDQRTGNNDDDELAELAAELVRRQPDVILVPAATAARFARAATTTIPIVSAGGGDLVAQGLAASYARPGGNVTGLSTPSLAGKQLQFLKEAVPTISRVAVLFDAENPEFGRGPSETAARTLGLPLQFAGAGGPADLEPIFDAAVREHTDGLFVLAGRVLTSNQTRIAELAIQNRLPSMWVTSEAVGRGGLMAYGPNRATMYRRAAYYVDRILKGAKPADLPIEQPREFEFVINLKTAQALGLTIPQHVLLQATEVIQ